MTGLAAAIDNYEIPTDRDGLIELHALHDKLSAIVAVADGAFDSAELWDLDGATSMTRWLVAECKMSNRDARRHTSVATKLAALPFLTKVFGAGDVSAGQIDVITTAVKPRHLTLFADHEAGLVPALAALEVHATVTVMNEWAAKADAVIDGDEPEQVTRSTLSHSRVGSYGRLDANLFGDDDTIVAEALRLTQRRDDDGETRTRAERAADALVELCARALRDHDTPKTEPGRQRPGVNVVIDAPDLAANELRELGVTDQGELDDLLANQAEMTGAVRAWYQTGLRRQHEPGGGSAKTLTGHDLSPALATAFGCDSSMRRVVTAGSTILDYGKPMSTLPQSVRDAVVIRDRRCRFRGCPRTIDWCEVHHIRERQHGGPDSVGNCVLLCARHHHILHRPHWHSAIAPDGTLTVTESSGRTWATHPPGPANHTRAGDGPPRPLDPSA